jgi:hypothetical protein
MSGLIWGGIGRGLANAGQAVGNFMMKDIEYQRQLEADDRKEANYIKRMEEAQRIKDDAAEAKAEALQQRVIKETAAAQTAAAEVPSARMAGQLSALQGRAFDEVRDAQGNVINQAPAMSQAELQQYIKDHPEYKKVYEDAGYVTKKNESLERSEGAIASAMAAGASSTTIGNLQKQRTAVLDEIKQEFKETKEAADRAQQATQNEAMNKRLEILGKNSETMARNAATAETRAAKETTGRNTRETTADLQRKVDVAKDEVAEALGVSKNEVNAKLKSLTKKAETDPNAKAELERVQEARDALTTARQRLTAWEAKSSRDTEGPAAAPAARDSAPPPRPDISKIQGVPAGSSVGSYIVNRGYEVKDRAGKVLGYVGK